MDARRSTGGNNRCAFFAVRLAAILLSGLTATPAALMAQADADVTLNRKADGYRGIWYMNEPSRDEYAYKYSGGLGTYCAKHKPFAVYSDAARKTFFCYGGTTQSGERRLLHMVSHFDHATRTVPRPTILLDKRTNDAHDNPVISIDSSGFIWIFSTSHGTSRPSYIHRSRKPYDIEAFDRIHAESVDGPSRELITNFSYMQVWPGKDHGFLAFLTRYGNPAKRTIGFMRSEDGVTWTPWKRLAAIEEGHYQVSGTGAALAGTMFNYHPNGKSVNFRTNLYYLQTADGGMNWTTVDGRSVTPPLTDVRNEALVRDYQSERLLVYLKDVRFDEADRPVLLYVTSPGYASGPRNDPRTWTLARWDGRAWRYSTITTSDNNYDMGELWMFEPDDWRIIAPTEPGPQAYNPGGEVAMWRSADRGATWKRTGQLTHASEFNHTYVRRVVGAAPECVAIWADGHGRRPSDSRLYFCDVDGNTFQLPFTMDTDHATPVPVR